eukprot:GHVT01100244.1.p1 GENE.GHVT01100244.1~~GHVT01100244.1.p1  ORF type:complete len:830 (+),score=137.10 GHVT01100244.1:203-2692(+)
MHVCPLENPVEDWPKDIIFFIRVASLLHGLCVQLDVKVPFLSIMVRRAEECLQARYTPPNPTVYHILPCGSDGAPRSKLALRLHHLMTRLWREGHVLGGQVAVAHEGRVIASVAVGQMGPVDRRPVTPQSLFCAYCLNKGLLATALLKLISAGEIDLDDLVCNWWDGFIRYGKRGVTVGEVLSHRAGLHACLPRDLTLSVLTDYEQMIRMIEDAPLATSPGTAGRYAYLVFGWLVSEIVHSVAFESIQDFVQRELINKLGLQNDIFFTIPKEKEEEDKGDAATKRDKAQAPEKKTADVVQPLQSHSKPISDERTFHADDPGGVGRDAKRESATSSAERDGREPIGDESVGGPSWDGPGGERSPELLNDFGAEPRLVRNEIEGDDEAQAGGGSHQHREATPEAGEIDGFFSSSDPHLEVSSGAEGNGRSNDHKLPRFAKTPTRKLFRRKQTEPSSNKTIQTPDDKKTVYYAVSGPGGVSASPAPLSAAVPVGSSSQSPDSGEGSRSGDSSSTCFPPCAVPVTTTTPLAWRLTSAQRHITLSTMSQEEVLAKLQSAKQYADTKAKDGTQGDCQEGQETETPTISLKEKREKALHKRLLRDRQRRAKATEIAAASPDNSWRGAPSVGTRSLELGEQPTGPPGSERVGPFDLIRTKPHVMDPLIYDSKKILQKLVPPTNARVTAEGMAKFYAAVAEGEVFDLKLLDQAREPLTTDSTLETLLLSGGASRVWGLGYQLFKCEWRPQDAQTEDKKRFVVGFGHGDFGGSVALAFPEIKLSVAIVFNDILKGPDATREILNFLLPKFGLIPAWNTPVSLHDLLEGLTPKPNKRRRG